MNLNFDSKKIFIFFLDMRFCFMKLALSVVLLQCPRVD